MNETYASQGFVILAFPCNQFGKQEPKPNDEIKAFAEERGAGKPGFVLLDKVEVNGKNADPIFVFLKAKLGGTLGSSIKWNFTQFLCTSDGLPFKRYGPPTMPLDFESDIKKLLTDVHLQDAASPSRDDDNDNQ